MRLGARARSEIIDHVGGWSGTTNKAERRGDIASHVSGTPASSWLSPSSHDRWSADQALLRRGGAGSQSSCLAGQHTSKYGDVRGTSTLADLKFKAKDAFGHQAT
ncbi:hypothetical protein CF319_g7543 [Tilletia indica]|nr:hypothetical protein CF319_g7543 [Tilletia indica]